MNNDGYITILSTVNWLVVTTLKINGSVRAVSFTSDSGFVLASGSDGDVYRFDIRMISSGGRGNSKGVGCVSMFKNQDGMTTSSLSFSVNGDMAVGSESGVVNIYKESSATAAAFSKGNSNFGRERTPDKTIMNLTSSVDNLKFNSTGEILAISTKRERDKLKLLHFPSTTVFQNWPTSKTPLGYVWSLDFSRNSGFMAVGNDKGKCLLYRLSHYDSI